MGVGPDPGWGLHMTTLDPGPKPMGHVGSHVDLRKNNISNGRIRERIRRVLDRLATRDVDGSDLGWVQITCFMFGPSSALVKAICGLSTHY